ncbi:hypothetical protein GCM10028773_20140 [Spirosoma koreense]
MPHPQRLIVRLEGNGNYTVVHFGDSQKPVLVSQTLKYFESRLPTFIRVSKSTLINPEKITQITRLNAKTLYIQLSDRVIILVSRRRVAAVTIRLVAHGSLITD